MELYILRHGLAVEHGTPGFSEDERPLTKEGKRKLHDIANGINKLEISFDLLLSSPLVRARQTAEIVAEKLGLTKKLTLVKELEPHGSTKDLIKRLQNVKRSQERVVLVGHEPYLSGLLSLLVCGDRNGSILLKKGGLAKLTVESITHGRCATLEWLLTPKQMSLIAH